MGTKAKARRQGSPASWTRRLVWRVVAWVLLVALVVVWVVFFRQQGLGGPAVYVEVNTAAMVPTIPKGDLVVAERQSSYKTGDVVAYREPGAGQQGPKVTVVGRIIEGDGTTGFVIKGDNLAAADPVHPTSADVVGKVWFHLRKALRWPITAAVGVLLVVLLIASWPSSRGKEPTAVVAGPTPAGAGERARRRPGPPGPKKVDTSATAERPATPEPATTPDQHLSEPTGDSYWESTKRQSQGPAPAAKWGRSRNKRS
jgi:signal peptidase I